MPSYQEHIAMSTDVATSSSAVQARKSELIAPSRQTSPSQTDHRSLDATRDARQLIRLLQCRLCSHPLNHPVTLPCGGSVCRSCMPGLHRRADASFPMLENRSEIITCPLPQCKAVHAIVGCNIDVTLSKILGLVRAEIISFRAVPCADGQQLLLEELDEWSLHTPDICENVRSAVLPGGRLVATYTMAEMGELNYHSEVKYTAQTGGEPIDRFRVLDTAVLQHLKDLARTELDCQVCYGLFVDPLTTSCGHTFCRKCIRRVFDHTKCCPCCRREQISMQPSVLPGEHPSNFRLSSLINGLFTVAAAARAQALRLEEMHHLQEMDVPLFLCSISFPDMPTFLHIFEPRYRLMIRRVIDGDGCFGMILHNPNRRPQGDLGDIPFYEYGTLLSIRNVASLPDGRSLLETIGTSRFRVRRHGQLDGYQVGAIERIDDVSTDEEEAIEASEIAQAATNVRNESGGNLPTVEPSDNDTVRSPVNSTSSDSNEPHNLKDLNAMSTVSLMAEATAYVGDMRAQSAPWLKLRVIMTYGECPTDPVMFVWWFASILPIDEEVKYSLLPLRTVRQRLKVCVSWVRQIRALTK
jgi:Lon protease-like protein